ncbi:MAG: threonine aldolase family protein, partial [Chloroflexota bacterium]
GKEAAVFVPSGTMGNLIALKIHTQPGDRVIVPERTHVYLGEAGGGGAVAGIEFEVLPTVQGIPPIALLARAVAKADYHSPPARLVTLENTHNLLGGIALDRKEASEYAALARSEGVAVHLDGARIFNAAVAGGCSAAELAAIADTVMFCLSKGLAAPVGSLLCGAEHMIHKARRFRKMLGGGMRQAGVLAAAGIVALETMVDRLGEDHEKARVFARGLQQIAPGSVVSPMPHTNIVNVRPSILGRGLDELVEELARRHILAAGTGADTVRFVTHLDVTVSDIEQTLEVFADLARTPNQGRDTDGAVRST